MKRILDHLVCLIFGHDVAYHGSWTARGEIIKVGEICLQCKKSLD